MGEGVPNIAALQGGWAAWLKANYPLAGNQVPTPDAAAEAWAASGGLAALGNDDAPVTIVEFSDFQCPYCRQHVLQTLPQILETYVDTGKVHYIFKDYPLPSHANAPKAAEAARCAGIQGTYWAMHDQLFEKQKEWSRQEDGDAIELFVGYAQDLGLDTEAFRECLASGQTGEQVRLNHWAGQQADVQGTPSFLINGQLLTGAHSFDTFQAILEGELQSVP